MCWDSWCKRRISVDARAIPPIEALLASTMDTWPEDTEDELLAANIRKGEQAKHHVKQKCVHVELFELMKMLCICCWQVCKRLRRHQSKWCVCTHNLLMLSTWADLVSKRSFVVQGLSSQPGHNSIQDVQRNYRPMLGWDMSRASEKTVDHCLLSLVMQLLGTWNSNIQQAWFGLIWHILTSWVIKAWPKVSLGDGLNIRNLKIMQASPLGMAVPAEGPSSASALKLNSVHLRCKWKGFVVIGCALIHLVLFLCCVWISDMDCRLWRLPPVFARAQSRPWLVAFNMALTCFNHFFVNSATSWQNQVHSCEDECWARHGEDQLSEMRCA